MAADGEILRWPGRVLSAADLRQSLNGHRHLILPARAVITPLAAEQIRAQGIRISRQPVDGQPAPGGRWGYTQERPFPLVQNALQAVEREGVALQELKVQGPQSACRWARAVAECVAHGECCGGVVFCEDAGLVCCVANKVAGLRAAIANCVAQVAHTAPSLAANLLVVEMPGRTFFEVRQILRFCGSAAAPVCPAGLACILQELDGHAHR
ncbi:MAG TPA: RpiB/LacA/LacB family sugar-phosphate isomerase [Gemmataceae bacterium]|nr:RpiB/LacA/LacB family sugar-phosphate isomerase [Gemmataceae bacterium]